MCARNINNRRELKFKKSNWDKIFLWFLIKIDNKSINKITFANKEYNPLAKTTGHIPKR